MSVEILIWVLVVVALAVLVVVWIRKNHANLGPTWTTALQAIVAVVVILFLIYLVLPVVDMPARLD